MATSVDALPGELAQLLGTTIAGGFRIDDVLGSGNMGVVFRGEQVKLKRPVAIKVLSPEIATSDRAAQRFQREAESVARLDHVNCLQVYDYGTTEGGLHYMVMPLLEGWPLDKLVEHQTLAPRRALGLIDQVLAGLSHAHQQGLVHRDLKPSNIIVVRSEGSGKEVAKIVDFGIAKIVDDEGSFQTRTGMLFGTPAYMSPEQAVGEPLDARSDLFSAGLLLYRLITGDVPHRSKSVVEQLRKRASKEVPPIPPPCPPVVSDFIRWMCALDLDERCPDAEAARDRIAELLDSAPLGAPSWDEPLAGVEPAGGDGATMGEDHTAGTTGTLGTGQLPAGMSPEELERTEPMGLDGGAAEETRAMDPTREAKLGPAAPTRRLRPPGAAAGSNTEAAAAPDAGEAPEATAEPKDAGDTAAATAVDAPVGLADATAGGAAVRYGLVAAAVIAALFGVWWLATPPSQTTPAGAGSNDTAGATAGPDAGSGAAAVGPVDDPDPDPGTSRTTDTSALGAGTSGDTGDDAGTTRGLLDKLKRVNETDPALALPFAERHALLDELREDPDTMDLVDETANGLIDLEQAEEAEEPCVVFLAALKTLSDDRSPEVRRAIRKAHVPAGHDPACADARKLHKRLSAGGKTSKPGPSTTGDDGGSTTSDEPKAGEITPKLGGLD